MQTRHGESQGSEQSSCIREINDSSKEKSIAGSASSEDSPESVQSETQADTKVSKELRRSSRAKFAPIPLVLSGGSSKTYWPPTAIAASRSVEFTKSSLKNDTMGSTELGNEIKVTMYASKPFKNTQAAGNNNGFSQESSEDDRVSLLPSSHQPSVMVTRLKRSKSPSTATDMARPKRAKGVVDLDEPTLKAFKEFLGRYEFDSLNEDEVMEDTLTTLKAANEKTRSILSELHADTYGSDDESVFEKCLQVEENHLIGQDFLREIVASIGQTTSGPVKKTNVINVQKGGIKVLVDQKTVGWIRRATGLHRNTSNAELTHKYATIRQESKSETSSRIATRRLVNDGSVNNKKRNSGLDIMSEAIAELEKDFGTPFPVYRFRSSPPKKKKLRRSCDGSSKKRRKSDGKQRSIRKKVRHQKVQKPSPRICTALRMLDDAWRFQSKPNKFVGRMTETEAEYLRRLSIPLHPQFVKAGIIHRQPTMNSLLKNHALNVLTNSAAPLPNPDLTDDDSVYDNMACLEGPPAQFAKYEFFYSDLDIEWYRENVVASTLGLSLDTPFSHVEWKSIRRRCKLIPRRFSKKFVASELVERNKYRKIVRSVQSSPHVCPSTFRYNVYKPVLPGTAVKAYCKIHQTVQPGFVVSYDPTNAIYLIEFEDEVHGYEFCPDSDVATSGIPNILIKKSKYYRRDEFESSFSQLQDAKLWSSSTIQHIELLLEKSVVGISKIFAPDNSTLSVPSKKLLEETANRDAFLTLLEVIESAGMRKSDILSLIANANTLAVDFLPFGEDVEHAEQSIPILSKATQDYLTWLHDNLRQTNEILSFATDYFQSLYGSSLIRAHARDP